MPAIQPLDLTDLHSKDSEITLTRYRHGDQYPLARILSDKRLWAHGFGDGPESQPLNRDGCLRFIQTEINISERIVYVIRHKTGAYLGIITYYHPDPAQARVEIGKLILDPDHWGHGYMARALHRLIKNAFDNGYHRVYAEADVLNQPSINTLTNAGFNLEGIRRHSSFHADGSCRDIAMYSITLADHETLLTRYSILLPSHEHQT